MNKILIVLALSTTAFSSQILAADPITTTYVPVIATPVYDPGFNWEGMYAGLNAGYAWGHNEVYDWEFSGDRSGFIGGAQIGYNLEFQGFLVGLEADYQFSDLSTTQDVMKAGMDHFGTIRARVGMDIGGFLPYATAGIAFGNIYAEPLDDPDDQKFNEYRSGLAVGAGVETAIFDNISVKAEYLYIDLGKKDFPEIAEFTNEQHIARIGFNFHF